MWRRAYSLSDPRPTPRRSTKDPASRIARCESVAGSSAMSVASRVKPMSKTDLNAEVGELRIQQKRSEEIPCRTSNGGRRRIVRPTKLSCICNCIAPHSKTFPPVFSPNGSARSMLCTRLERAYGKYSGFAQFWSGNQIDLSEERANQRPISTTNAYRGPIGHGRRGWLMPLAYFLRKSRRRMERPDRAFACGLPVRVGRADSRGAPRPASKSRKFGFAVRV
jgi:hypothetical protein